jgi:hypothetical protein
MEPIAFPTDPRVEHRFAQLSGTRYHYLYAEPQDRPFRETVFLVCMLLSCQILLEADILLPLSSHSYLVVLCLTGTLANYARKHQTSSN